MTQQGQLSRSVPEVSRTLIECIGGSLAGYGFKDRWRPALSALECRGHWRLCTLNLNRAVSLLMPASAGPEVGRYCQQMKWRLLRQMRFVPHLYEVGLQLVVIADDTSAASLGSWVDKFSNQLVVLQSIFVVDPATRQFRSARTWGQLFTGKYQDAIGEGIRSAGFAEA